MEPAETPSHERSTEIASNLGEVQAAVEHSQKVQSRLVAVSKYKPGSDIMAAYNLGQRHFGENYVQELCEKSAALPADIKWHFIGRLQSNKCKALAGIPNLWAVETIDSAAKAHKMNDAWRNAGNQNQLNVFVQVNTSEEQNKGGVEKSDVESVVQEIIGSCAGLCLKGLMTIGSIEGSQKRPNPDFLALVALRDELKHSIGVDLELSMGMSDDFEHALELGATNVRVGSKIFGARPTKENAQQN
ncbi:hypothetical protein IWW36_004529 [Coemansia brasiliensis]|uniref:Pyridoxal phosphate homeostasis protein n=1 Tax=Coemansia brasiliensis TaxID=2650707 RepID=A0A9W8I5J3_9FUNG|nr:hypothetical protein IWW36_004529 [Coemansia brasiliensis]